MTPSSEKRSTLLMETKTPLLGEAGVSIIIATEKHHEAVGRSKTIIKKNKEVVISVLSSFNFVDVLDISHKVSLIFFHLNELPILFQNFEIIMPNSLEAAVLKHSP